MPFFSLRITLLSQETAVKEPTIPLQRVTLHKDVENVRTPLKVVSHPPQGWSPPFNTEQFRLLPRLLGPVLSKR